MKVRLAERAEAQLDERRTWWRAHREERDLFDEIRRGCAVPPREREHAADRAQDTRALLPPRADAAQRLSPLLRSDRRRSLRGGGVGRIARSSSAFDLSDLWRSRSDVERLAPSGSSPVQSLTSIELRSARSRSIGAFPSALDEILVDLELDRDGPVLIVRAMRAAWPHDSSSIAREKRRSR